MGTKYKWVKVAFCVMLFAFRCSPVKAQDQDMMQLLLNIEKLAQFKSILADMQKGYTMLTQGYGLVKNMTEGNFSLHSVFLNGLLKVNPEIAKYRRVADFIADEGRLLSEYKRAWQRFQSAGVFSVSELAYLSRVYSNLTSEALGDVNRLADVLLADKLRMSDDERLGAIDGLYSSGQTRLTFLRHFNTQVSLLQRQRRYELNETQTLQNLYGHEN